MNWRTIVQLVTYHSFLRSLRNVYIHISQLTMHIENNNLFPDLQSGYRKSHSCDWFICTVHSATIYWYIYIISSGMKQREPHNLSGIPAKAVNHASKSLLSHNPGSVYRCSLNMYDVPHTTRILCNRATWRHYVYLNGKSRCTWTGGTVE